MQQPNTQRSDAVRRAAEHWKRQLLDVSGRNRLLNYRDLKTGTLDLTPSDDSGMDARALDALLAGKQVRMTALFPGGDGPLRDEAPRNDARKRLSRIQRQARENLEEKGLNTLHLAAGLATWTVNAGSAPHAPVILIPVEIEPEGAGRWDFIIKQSGEPNLNPALVRILLTQHGLDLSDDEEAVVDATLNSHRDIERYLKSVESRLGKAPNFTVEPRIVLANFGYVNIAMVTDLDNSIDAFARNDIVAALAGSVDARNALAAKICDPSPSKPDYDPPESEFLILDADSSQHRAISRVLGGESIVVWGPPGTGKSQTIANLIASLAAVGKRVLFVAEKRAAIDVVVARLDKAGLSDLVMDAHGGIKSKREFARNMDDSIRKIRAIPAQGAPELHGSLSRSRNELVAHKDAMHQVREPYGVSLFDLQTRLLGVPEPARADIRLHRKDQAVNAAMMPNLKLDIQEWVERGGHSFLVDYPEWSKSAVSTEVEARDALTLARNFAIELSEAERMVAPVLEEAGFPASGSVAESTKLLQLLLTEQDFQSRYGQQIYNLDLAALRESLRSAKQPIRRLLAPRFSASYRNARETARASLSNAANALSDQGLLDVIEKAADRLAQYRELGSNGVPRVPAGLSVALSAMDSLTELLEQAERIFKIEHLLEEPIEGLRETMGRLASQEEAAAKLPRIRRLERRFKEVGIDPVLDAVGDRIPPEYAAEAVEYAWLSAAWDELSFVVGGFTATSHNRHHAQFIELDKRHLKGSAGRVKRQAAEHAVRMMNDYPSEADLIRREAAKKTRHLPVRRLFRQAPHALTAIRPCWTMSPLLVAELTPAAANMFDVVIFDEASQVPPAEAMGSLARAPLAVIAGDDRQLPPTTFFSGGEEDENEDDDGDDLQSIILTEDIESILQAAKAGPLREELLQWHYRSKDGRLIAFSNAHIYGESLTAFPDAAEGAPMFHHLVPFRSLTQRHAVSHPDEVDNVVDMAIAHASEHPNESLGVIAFGIRHANNIEETLRYRLRDLAEPSLDKFFSDGADERFFVKNIERVQGDERDVIILSVGYHKDAKGSLPYRFGPLNQEGGERRLNVAVTRARLRMHVVSSFSHYDMDPDRSDAKGVQLLRQYLEFAASGGTELGTSPSDIPLNAFELDVLHRLQDSGIPVTPQYGVSGYRIDFACAHPDQPGRMVLAIEADGASYHSGSTARERDRLRQEQLEARGWTFHRIWSTNWFKNRDEEIQRAAAAWKHAVSEANRKDETGDDASITSVVPEPDAPASPPPMPTRGPRPLVPRRDSIGEYSHRELVALAQWILSDTLLRTDEELMAEMRKELGFKRRGNRIDEALRKAIRDARRLLDAR